MRTRIVTIAGAGLLGSLSIPLNAQTPPPDTAAERADARLSRLDALDREGSAAVSFADDGTKEIPPPFSLRLAIPFTYNTNVGNLNSGEQGDFHFTPSARLDWSKTAGEFVLFARLAADGDSYTEKEESNASTLSGRLGLRYDGDRFGLLKPYLHYVPIIIYGAGFANHQVTLHNITAGVSAAIKFDATTKLVLDGQITRREASLLVAEQNRFRLGATLSGEFSPDISWAIDPGLSLRHYTGGSADGRKDTNILTIVGVSAALNKAKVDEKKGTPAIFLDVNMSFERNFSNRDGKDYSVWDVGPSLTLKAAF